MQNLPDRPVQVAATAIGGHDTSEAIVESGALLGFESDNQRPPADLPVGFVDWPFSKGADPDFEAHLATVKAEQPAIAVAPDVEDGRDPETVYSQADQLAEHAETVVVVPKDVHPSEVPDRFRVGVPLANFGRDDEAQSQLDEIGVDENAPEVPWSWTDYQDAGDLHLLGASPTIQLEFAQYVDGVRSIDGATAIMVAQKGEMWAPTRERNWHQTGSEQFGVYERMQHSLGNIIRAWADQRGYEPPVDPEMVVPEDPEMWAEATRQADRQAEQAHRDVVESRGEDVEALSDQERRRRQSRGRPIVSTETADLWAADDNVPGETFDRAEAFHEAEQAALEDMREDMEQAGLEQWGEPNQEAHTEPNQEPMTDGGNPNMSDEIYDPTTLAGVTENSLGDVEDALAATRDNTEDTTMSNSDDTYDPSEEWSDDRAQQDTLVDESKRASADTESRVDQGGSDELVDDRADVYDPTDEGEQASLVSEDVEGQADLFGGQASVSPEYADDEFGPSGDDADDQDDKLDAMAEEGYWNPSIIKQAFDVSSNVASTLHKEGEGPGDLIKWHENLDGDLTTMPGIGEKSSKQLNRIVPKLRDRGVTAYGIPKEPDADDQDDDGRPEHPNVSGDVAVAKLVVGRQNYALPQQWDGWEGLSVQGENVEQVGSRGDYVAYISPSRREALVFEGTVTSNKWSLSAWRYADPLPEYADSEDLMFGPGGPDGDDERVKLTHGNTPTIEGWEANKDKYLTVDEVRAEVPEPDDEPDENERAKETAKNLADEFNGWELTDDGGSNTWSLKHRQGQRVTIQYDHKEDGFNADLTNPDWPDSTKWLTDPGAREKQPGRGAGDRKRKAVSLEDAHDAAYDEMARIYQQHTESPEADDGKPYDPTETMGSDDQEDHGTVSLTVVGGEPEDDPFEVDVPEQVGGWELDTDQSWGWATWTQDGHLVGVEQTGPSTQYVGHSRPDQTGNDQISTTTDPSAAVDAAVSYMETTEPVDDADANPYDPTVEFSGPTSDRPISDVFRDLVRPREEALEEEHHQHHTLGGEIYQADRERGNDQLALAGQDSYDDGSRLFGSDEEPDAGVVEALESRGDQEDDEIDAEAYAQANAGHVEQADSVPVDEDKAGIGDAIDVATPGDWSQDANTSTKVSFEHPNEKGVVIENKLGTWETFTETPVEVLVTQADQEAAIGAAEHYMEQRATADDQADDVDETADEDRRGETVQFGTLTQANDWRDDNADALHATDARRTKTVKLHPDADRETIENAAMAATATMDQSKKYGQETLSDFERGELEDLTDWSWGTHGFHAMASKAVLLEEGGTPWLDHYSMDLEPIEHVSVVEHGTDMAVEQGLSGPGETGEIDDSDPDLKAQAKSVDKAMGERCGHARDACEEGHEKACESLLQDCGWTDDEISELMERVEAMGEDPNEVYDPTSEGDTGQSFDEWAAAAEPEMPAEPSDDELADLAPTSTPDELRPAALRALKKAWTGYKVARSDARKSQAEAEEYASIINGVRAVNDQEPIDFDAQEWEGGEVMPDDPTETYPAPEGGEETMGEAAKHGHASNAAQTLLTGFSDAAEKAGDVYDPTEEM